METSKILFKLLRNRLDETGELFPKHIGEFDGSGSLPNGEYPPIYSWLDKSRPEVLILSFNDPLLEDLGRREAALAGIEIDDGAIGEALDVLKEVSCGAFQRTLLAMEEMMEEREE